MHYLIGHAGRSTHVKILTLAAACAIGFVQIASHAKLPDRTNPLPATGMDASQATLLATTQVPKKDDRWSVVRSAKRDELIVRTDFSLNVTYAMRSPAPADDSFRARLYSIGASATSGKSLIGCETAFSRIRVPASANFYIRCLAGIPHQVGGSGTVAAARASLKSIAS